MKGMLWMLGIALWQPSTEVRSTSRGWQAGLCLRGKSSSAVPLAGRTGLRPLVARREKADAGASYRLCFSGAPLCAVLIGLGILASASSLARSRVSSTISGGQLKRTNTEPQPTPVLVKPSMPWCCQKPRCNSIGARMFFTSEPIPGSNTWPP